MNLESIQKSNREEYPLVEFTDNDLGIITYLSTVRNKAQQPHDDYEDFERGNPSTISTKDHFDSLVEVDEVGVAGELAFSKLYGTELPYASDTHLNEGAEEYDFKIYLEPADSILRVDVKSTPKKGNLLIPKETRITADMYVLARVFERKVRFEGFTTGIQARDGYEPKMHVGMHHPCRKVPRKDLIPLPDPDDVIPMETEYQGVENEIPEEMWES